MTLGIKRVCSGESASELQKDAAMPRVSVRHFEKWADLFKTIFADSATDVMPDHNQAMDALDVALEQGLLAKNQNTTLLHFDTHADAVMSNDPDQGIGNYVNHLMLDESISTFYWVLPDQSKTDPGVKERMWGDGDTSGFTKSPDTRTFFVRKEKKRLFFHEPDDFQEHPERYRTVLFKKVVLSELPDFTGATGLWVDICGDYFANNGNDTPRNVQIQYQGMQGFSNFLNGLKQKGIRPAFTTAALSREYLTEESTGMIACFFHAISFFSKVSDFVVGCRHSYERKAKEQLEGTFNTKRIGEVGFELLYGLDVIDADTHPNQMNGKISLDDQQEYERAVEWVGKFGVTGSKPKDMLDRLDALDGTADRVIDLQVLQQKIEVGELSNNDILKNSDQLRKVTR